MWYRRSSCHPAMRAARQWVLAGSVSALACALGYGLGLSVLVNWLVEAHRESEGLDGVGVLREHAAELLVFRYAAVDPSTRALRWDYIFEMTWLGVSLALVLFAAATVGLLAARHGASVFVPIRLRNVPREDMALIRARWKRVVRSSAPRAWLVAIVGLGIGLSGSFVGACSAAWSYELRLEAAWARGAPQTARMPHPIAGPFAFVDGAWVVGGTALAAGLMTAVPARRRLRRTGEFAVRWCRCCGFPAPTQWRTRHGDPAIRPGPVEPGRCPECGSQRHHPAEG